MAAAHILPYAVLGGGVLVASTASILIRVAQGEGMPSTSIAAYRLGLAALVLLPLASTRAGGELARLKLRDTALAAASGACLALHFWAWTSSLEYTSVASSTALVTTNPLWVGLASLLLFRERLSVLALYGIAVCIAGTLLIFASGAAPDLGAKHPNPALGNALALVGAVSASAYLLIGRALRHRLSLLAYVFMAYAVAALMLWAGALASSAQVRGFSLAGYLCVAALALGPQLLGHTAFNWSLRRLSATFVALSILGEPVGSALLAFLLFGERLGPLQFGGFLLILTGILFAARGEQQSDLAANRG